MVFFRTRLGKSLIWQKFSYTRESDFKEKTEKIRKKEINKERKKEKY